MALRTVQVQELDSHRLSLQTGSNLVVDETFMNRSKPAFAEEITRGETVCYNF